MSCYRTYSTHCPHCAWSGRVGFGDIRTDVELPDGSFLMTELICRNCHRQVISPFQDRPQFISWTKEEDDALIEWGKKPDQYFNLKGYSAENIIQAMLKREPRGFMSPKPPIQNSDLSGVPFDVAKVQNESQKTAENSISVVAMVLIAVLYAVFQILKK